jgi:hypothetical protein
MVSIAIVVFNLVALSHNMAAWEYASQKARAACSVAAKCAGVASGLPGSLNGVYFFANGFPECVEMQRTGNEGSQSCVLFWDPNTDQLSRR